MPGEREDNMKQVIMYKWNSVKKSTWGWSIDEVYDDWNSIYSDPYIVEIPDDFMLGENVCGEKMYFKAGQKTGYIVSETSQQKNCRPVLIGGSTAEWIVLHIIGPVIEDV